MAPLSTCAACDCLVRPLETSCPHCGAPRSAAAGSERASRAAVLLGLVTATACGANVVFVEENGGGGASNTSSTTTTGAGGAGASGGGFSFGGNGFGGAVDGGFNEGGFAPLYGVAPAEGGGGDGSL